MTALVGLLTAALIASPAAAWDAHALSHASTPVAAFEHHHHGDDGSVDVHDHDDESDQRDSDEDGGHDHMPSVSAGWSGVLGGGPTVMAQVATPIVHRSLVEPAPPTIVSEPQKRPPRFR